MNLMVAMSESLQAQLERGGYAVVPDFLESEVTLWLIDHFAAIHSSETGDEINQGTAFRSKRGSVFAIRNLLTLPFIHTLIDSVEVRALIDAVCPGGCAVRAILFDKTGEANWTVPWHQDRSIAVDRRASILGFGPWSEKAGVVHVQPPVELLRQIVTLRFSLDECGPGNGPLRIIPGTHRRILDPPAIQAAVKKGPELRCLTSAGGVVLMRAAGASCVIAGHSSRPPPGAPH